MSHYMYQRIDPRTRKMAVVCVAKNDAKRSGMTAWTKILREAKAKQDAKIKAALKEEVN